MENKNLLILEEGRTYTSHVGDLIKIKKINKEADIVQLYNIATASSMWLPMKWAREKITKLVR